MYKEVIINEGFGIKESILFQLDMCWQLYLYHTDNLGEEEAHWSFSPSLQVRKKDGEWWQIGLKPKATRLDRLVLHG